MNEDILLEATAAAVVNAENAKGVKSGIAAPTFSHTTICNVAIFKWWNWMGRDCPGVLLREKKENVRDVLM